MVITSQARRDCAFLNPARQSILIRHIIHIDDAGKCQRKCEILDFDFLDLLFFGPFPAGFCSTQGNSDIVSDHRSRKN